VRILVIDNYDSFVYNLVQYLAQLGCQCVVRRNDAVEPGDVAAADAVLGPAAARLPCSHRRCLDSAVRIGRRDGGRGDGLRTSIR